MNGILTKEGYRIMQHEENHDIMIYKDGRLLRRRKAARPLSQAELLRSFDFEMYVVGGLEDDDN